MDDLMTNLATASTTTWLLLVLFIALTAPVAYGFRRKRLWMPYYVLATFAITLILVWIARLTGFDEQIALWESQQVTWLAGFFGAETQVAEGAGILCASQTGWSLLKVGIECSAVLEMAVLVGLVMVFPAYSFLKRVTLTVIGLVATYIANLARLLIIVLIVSEWGGDAVFIAHAVIGRAFFFIFVVILYWYLLTRTSLRFLVKEVEGR